MAPPFCRALVRGLRCLVVLLAFAPAMVGCGPASPSRPNGEGGGRDSESDKPPEVAGRLGTAGGRVRDEGVWLEVGAGVIPDGQRPAVALGRRQTLGRELARFHPPEIYRAVGSAVDLRLPFDTDRPARLAIAWEADDLPAGFEPDDLTVFAHGPALFAPMPGAPPSMEVFPAREPVPLPTEVRRADEQNGRHGRGEQADQTEHGKAGVATVEVHGSGVFQLVALREPVVWRAPSADGDGSDGDGSEGAPEAIATELRDRRPGDPAIGVGPTLRATLDAKRRRGIRRQLDAALRRSLERYARLGFATPPAARVTVLATAALPVDTAGAHAANVIRINPQGLSDGQIAKMIAHQVFHLVQFRHANRASVRRFFGSRGRDGWVVEGTANWAADVVYDDIPAQYFAPELSRFRTPLNKPGGSTFSPHLYETVAFWKWLEAHRPGALVRGFAELRRRSRTIVTSEYRVLDSTARSLDGVLRASLSAVEPMRFFEDVLYFKDFERDETDRDELWGNLGARRNVGISIRLAAEEVRREPLELTATLPPTMTADAQLVEVPSDGPRRGRIHLRFEPSGNPDLAVTVISRDDHRKKRVIGLSEPKEITFPVRAGSEILVIAADPQWEPSSETTSRLNYEVWVEPEG